MIKKFTKKLAIGSVGGLLLVAAFGVALHINLIKLPVERQIHVQYAADFSDDRILMGASHNVFVGKVIKHVGDKQPIEIPETQFAVEVIYNIKGNLSGTVVVDQYGGYDNGILYYIEDAAPLLKPGAAYLLATMYNRYNEEDWYILNSHPNGWKLITQDSNLNKVQLLSLAKNDAKVKALQEAYKNEILLDADIKNNNTRNSYQSLQKN